MLTHSRIRSSLWLFLVVVMALLAGGTAWQRRSWAVAETRVVVDNTKPHQVMEGFGASHEPLVYEGLGDLLPPSLRARAIEAVYHQVGITMGNLGIGAYESPGGYLDRANDDSDPFHFNPSGFNWHGSDAAKQKLVDLAQPFGFSGYYLSGRINTRWEMPWLAQIRAEDYGRYLDEAGEHVAAAAIHWRDAYGMVPRYYMLFNEPLTGNHELANGTVQDVVEIVKRAGARLRREGFKEMKFVVPGEETEEASLNVASAVLADPEARQYVGAIAYHPYPYGSVYAHVPTMLATSGTGKPDPGRIAVREQLRELGRKYGIPVWMTEVSNGGVRADSFDDLRGRAIQIHDELVYADAAAYFGMLNMWDSVSQQNHFGNNDLFSQEGNIVLIDQTAGAVSITGMGYAIGHYARWIRRGAVRIEATSSDPLLQVTAFRDDGRQKLVMVLINNAASNSMVEVDLQGFTNTQPLAFGGEQSTAEQAWKPLPAFTSSSPSRFSVTLPGRSVTTISAPLKAPPN